MKKISTNHGTPLHSATVLLIVLLFLNINVKTSDCLTIVTNRAAGCNGTRIADCLADEEEFMMESEISRRLLARPGKTISYSAEKPKLPFCDRDVYNSCLPNPNTNFDKRPCNYENHCQRP